MKAIPLLLGASVLCLAAVASIVGFGLIMEEKSLSTGPLLFIAFGILLKYLVWRAFQGKGIGYGIALITLIEFSIIGMASVVIDVRHGLAGMLIVAAVPFIVRLIMRSK